MVRCSIVPVLPEMLTNSKELRACSLRTYPDFRLDICSLSFVAHIPAFKDWYLGTNCEKWHHDTEISTMRKLFALTGSALLLSVPIAGTPAIAQEVRYVLPGYAPVIDTRELSRERKTWFHRCAESGGSAGPAIPGAESSIRTWSGQGQPSDCPTGTENKPMEFPVYGKKKANVAPVTPVEQPKSATEDQPPGAKDVQAGTNTYRYIPLQ